MPSRSILVESEIPLPTLIKIGGNGGGASWPRGPSSFADQKRKDKRVVGFRDRQRAFIGVPGRSGSSREEDGGHVRAGLDELRAQAGVVVPESEDPSAVVASGSIQTQATIAGVRRSALKRYGKEGADDDDWDRGFAAKRARERRCARAVPRGEDGDGVSGHVLLLYHGLRSSMLAESPAARGGMWGGIAAGWARGSSRALAVWS